MWGICFGMHYFVSFLALQSSWRGIDSRLLCFYCLPDVFCLPVFWGSSSRWPAVFLVILTYVLWNPWWLFCTPAGTRRQINVMTSHRRWYTNVIWIKSAKSFTQCAACDVFICSRALTFFFCCCFLRVGWGEGVNIGFS